MKKLRVGAILNRKMKLLIYNYGVKHDGEEVGNTNRDENMQEEGLFILTLLAVMLLI